MLLQFIINGVITGILYSLLAIGFALVYNTTKVFHIAEAGLYVVAAYVFWASVNFFHLPVFVSALVSIALTICFSLLCEIVVYRPLYNKHSSSSVSLVASIGIMTVLVNLVAMVFGNSSKVVSSDIAKTFSFSGFSLTSPQIWQMSLGIIILLAFIGVVNFTDSGIRLRALSGNQSLFQALGYDSKGLRSIVFVLSGFFIAVASCLTVYDVGMDPNMGMNVLINALVAMIIGGIGRFSACLIGGLSLGLLQSLVLLQFSTSWQNAVTFIILLVFLFFRPQGIMGYKQRVF